VIGLGKYTYGAEIPMGLGMALMQNPAAMDCFYALPREAKQRIINHTHSVSSKEEMKAYVASLVSSGGL
jgi:uncharacterized protein YdeI (YjbR/CyaY-like superfamily)